MNHKKSKSSDVEKKTEEVAVKEVAVKEVAVKEVAVKEVAEKNVLKNISRQHHRVYGNIVKPGAIYEVSDADLKQENASKRIDNAIKQGYLERL